MGVGVLAAVIGMIRARDEIVCHLKNAVLFLVFITLCIGSSSVTIRVEMRWVYVAYAAALLFFAYLSRVMGKAGILVLLYGCLIFPVETYYRDNWDNLYLWAPQSQYNSWRRRHTEHTGTISSTRRSTSSGRILRSVILMLKHS